MRAQLEKIQASSTEIFNAAGEDPVDGFVQGGIDIASDSVKQWSHDQRFWGMLSSMCRSRHHKDVIRAAKKKVD